MTNPGPVEPVKLFVATLFALPNRASAVESQLEKRWGPIDFRGLDHPFDVTDYYVAEMGPELTRRLISFEALMPPENLRQAKLETNAIENAMAVDGNRSVNLDVGYLDHNKIVLASVKYAGQKIHLGNGIYADLVARYRQGRYQPFEWSFPDFCDGRYDDELRQIRQRYLRQR
ncbi:MAG: DUF4416 family protein [Planctomycetota bacterium]